MPCRARTYHLRSVGGRVWGHPLTLAAVHLIVRNWVLSELLFLTYQWTG